MLKIPWTAKNSNEVVLKEAEEKKKNDNVSHEKAAEFVE
jgi:hypothetical protein